MVSGRFGPEPSCVPYEGADLAEQLSEAVANIHGEIAAYEVEDELTEEDNSIPPIDRETFPIHLWTAKYSVKTAVWLPLMFLPPLKTVLRV